MAQINPINLGQPSLTIGPQAQLNPLQLAALAQQQAQKTAQAPPSMPSRDTNYSALAAALQGTPQVTGGTWGEAIADALAGGLRGRAAAQEQQSADKQQAAQNMWQQALQQRQEDQWNTQDKQQQRLSDWAQTQGPDAQIDPQAAYQAYEQQQALANQPLTPYQQQSLAQNQSQFAQSQATARRGQDLDAAAAMARLQNQGGGLTRLRGSDASQLTRIQQAGENARALQQYADQFEAANRNTGTGPAGQFTQYFSGDMAAMRQASSLMRGLMRPVGSGATSDYEQRLYAQGAPDPALPGPANQERIDNIRKLAALNNARQFFYENYADANGTLRGAEQAFQGSDEFRQLAAPRTAAAPGGGAPASSAPVRVASPTDAQRLPPGTLYTTPDGRTFRR